MTRIVIAAFKPRPGKRDQLVAVVKKHRGILCDQGLVTNHPSYVMEATDGTILEVFEWKSSDAIEQAHQNPEILALWQEFAAACEYVPLSTLDESRNLFPEFRPIQFPQEST